MPILALLPILFSLWKNLLSWFNLRNVYSKFCVLELCHMLINGNPVFLSNILITTTKETLLSKSDLLIVLQGNWKKLFSHLKMTEVEIEVTNFWSGPFSHPNYEYVILLSSRESSSASLSIDVIIVGFSSVTSNRWAVSILFSHILSLNIIKRTLRSNKNSLVWTVTSCGPNYQ